MDVTEQVTCPANAERVFDTLSDLRTAPEWLGFVTRVTAAEVATGDPGPAWSVDLAARLGPLERSKRLRMVRTECIRPERVRFERRELDSRTHSPWIIEADLSSPGVGPRTGVPATEGAQTEVRVHLHYGGGLFGPVLSRVLSAEIQRSRPRFVALVARD